MSNATTSNGVAMPTERQVGLKSKRGDEYDGDDIEWDDEPPTGTVNRHLVYIGTVCLENYILPSSFLF